MISTLGIGRREDLAEGDIVKTTDGALEGRLQLVRKTVPGRSFQRTVLLGLDELE